MISIDSKWRSYVNGGYFGPYASSGGYKRSGVGRERGVEGIRAFQQIKHLSVGPST